VGDERVTLRETMALMRELDDALSRCMRCGFCQEVCPVYGQTFREADVARGKLALLQDLGRELTRDARAVDERLNRCLLCTSCESICPPGVGTAEIFLRARAAIAAYRGLGELKKAVFRLVLPHPRLFGLLARLGAVFQGAVLRPANGTVGTSTIPLLTPAVGPRHVPGLPGRGFTSVKGRILEPSGRSGLKVLYFPGCVPDRLFPGISDATLKILRHHDVGCVMPEDMCCCGIPALASGDRKGFMRLLARNLCRMSLDFDFLVTSCATCASTIRETWPRYAGAFAGHELELIGRLSERTCDLSSFLVNVLKADFPDRQAVAGEPAGGDGRGPAGDVGREREAGDGLSAHPRRKVTYHDPCHLLRALNVSREPRKILMSLPGWEYVEMPEAGRCCGSGGSFTLLHPDVSLSIGMRKRANVVSVSPDTVATSCPACMIQLMDMLSRSGDRIEVRHLAELYAESLEPADGAGEGVRPGAEIGPRDGSGGGPARSSLPPITDGGEAAPAP
jgi:glycolate oxidase iron-sulfur subunit